MKIVLSSLKEYLSLSQTPEELAHILTMGGIEVDDIVPIKTQVEGAIAVSITAVAPHPTRKGLHVVDIFDGKKSVKVVSRAPNCIVGLRTAFAPVGAKIAGENLISTESFDGIISAGMLLSEKELGLTSHDQGLIDLSHLDEGTKLDDYFTDIVFDVSLTPNLGHAMSVFGVARQLSALLNIPLKEQLKELPPCKEANLITVTVEARELVPRYSCIQVNNVDARVAPLWMRLELERCGMHSVNAIVDCTNLVLLRLGQPLHAFDSETLSGGAIFASEATGNEEAELLDNRKVKVPAGSIVIRDNKAVCAIGGIIGCKPHAVRSSTTSIVVESAYFDARAIRRAKTAFGLCTESSKRFERGTDPKSTVRALQYAYELIQKVFPEAGITAFCDVANRDFSDTKILCRRARASAILGVEISLSEMELAFTRQGFSIEWAGEDGCIVSVPPYRYDIQEEIDLIEEIWRILGITIAPQGEIRHVTSKLLDNPLYRFSMRVRDALLRQGMQELVTCNLISPLLQNLTKNYPIDAREIVRVMNPTSEEQSILRPSLLPSLLHVVQHNVKMKNFALSGFEIAHIHLKKNEKYQEYLMAGLVLFGDRENFHFEQAIQAVDFFDLKGLIENLLISINVRDVQFIPSHFELFHPHKQAAITVAGLHIGTFGELHPSVQRTLDISEKVFVGELNIQDLLALPKEEVRFAPLAQYPSSERDWTETVDEALSYGQFMEYIAECKGPLVESVHLRGLYRDSTLGSEKKNITVRFVFRHKERTVEQKEVDQEFQRIVDTVKKHI